METGETTEQDEVENKNFNFEISLSVLNHLGRNLYRNFITVLGEAISNAWDADAKNVWINIDRDRAIFTIKDDGKGMTADDFQGKFLKIGYSKRSEGVINTENGRPFIGAKGIGKLALLSCADKVSIFSKQIDSEYIGGLIVNSDLDDAIKNDLTPDKYPLEELDYQLIDKLKVNHEKGTIICFENTKDLIKNSVGYIRKLIALNFHFSLIDEEFSIHVNGSKVNFEDIKDLTDSTEFAWVFNESDDDFVANLTNLVHEQFPLTTSLGIQGFIASVKKPRDLKITGTEERATIDLFVNGRLREKNILRHIPTQRIVESYLYGQVHFDSMDTSSEDDPFTSSREGIVEDDPNFISLLDYLKRDALPKIFDGWDEQRLNRGDEGDEENDRKTKKARKARALYSATRDEFKLDPDNTNKDKVDKWLDELRDDAEFNIESYVDCFLSENLIRKYIAEKQLPLSKGVEREANDWKQTEVKNKGKANINFDLRKNESELSYLGMAALAVTAEGPNKISGQQTISIDAVEYTPVRNVVGHTGLLTDIAKFHLKLKYENIKARIRNLLKQ